MGPSIKVIGARTNSTVRDVKPGQMGLNTKVITLKARNMAKVNSSGQTVAPMMVSSLRTISKASESIAGLMAANSKANGKITKWREREFSHGQITESTRAIILMIRKKATVCFTGLMAGNMTDNG